MKKCCCRHGEFLRGLNREQRLVLAIQVNLARQALVGRHIEMVGGVGEIWDYYERGWEYYQWTERRKVGERVGVKEVDWGGIGD